MKLLTSIVWRLWRLNCEEIIEVVQQVMHIESIRGYPAKGVGEPGEQNGEDMSCIRELTNAR